MICVEGWAAITWGGVRLRHPPAQANVRYVYFKSADGYYESWDLASAAHPQTLMAYQKMVPLSVGNAPLRLASPLNSVTSRASGSLVTLVSDLLPIKATGIIAKSGTQGFNSCQ